MESLYFLVPIALIFIAVALRFLFWALNNGQYDNLDTEAHRILFDEHETASKNPYHPTASEKKSNRSNPADSQPPAVPSARSETSDE